MSTCDSISFPTQNCTAPRPSRTGVVLALEVCMAAMFEKLMLEKKGGDGLCRHDVYSKFHENSRHGSEDVIQSRHMLP